MQPEPLNKAPVPVNPPHLMRPVRVQVLRPFRVAGKPLAIGDEVEIEYHLARDLWAIGKVELLA
jgi:hypothetical protein